MRPRTTAKGGEIMYNWGEVTMYHLPDGWQRQVGKAAKLQEREEAVVTVRPILAQEGLEPGTPRFAGCALARGSHRSTPGYVRVG